MDNKLLIGIITKPQGIKGEVKVRLFTDSVASFDTIKQVYIDSIPYKVLHKRSSGEDLFISLKGIADRTEAEKFRNKEIYALREEITKDEDSYFIVDIIGCDVFDYSDNFIGKIIDISSGRTDIYYAKNEKNTVVFPMLKALEPQFDIENKKVTINGQKLLEVCMYED